MNKKSFSIFGLLVFAAMQIQSVSFAAVVDDSQLVRAIQYRTRVNFLEANNLVVTRLLPDDNQGLKHQKFMVQTSNGQSVMIVYNTDLCPKVPARVGDKVSVGGEYIYNRQGGLVHWTHYDPSRRRPSGYIGHGTTAYCYR